MSETGKNSRQMRMGVLLNYIYIFAANLSAVFIVSWLVGSMSESAYGVFVIAFSVSTYFIMAEFGIGNFVIRYVSKYRLTDDRGAEKKMLYNAALTYIVVGGFTMLALFMFYACFGMIFKALTAAELDMLKSFMLVVIIGTLLQFAQNYFYSILMGYERFIFTRIVNIIRLVLRIAMLWIICAFRMGGIYVLITDAALTALTTLALYIYIRVSLKIRFGRTALDRALVKKFMRLGSYVYLAYIIENLFANLGSLLVGATTGADEAGVFYIAVTFSTVFLQLSNTVVAFSLPRITALSMTGDEVELTRGIAAPGRIQAGILLLLFIGFAAIGDILLPMWLGPAFSGAYLPALVLMGAMCLYLCFATGDVVLQAKNLHGRRMAISVVSVTVSLLVSLLCLKYLQTGIVGAAIGFAAGAVCGKFLLALYFYVKCGVCLGAYMRKVVLPMIPVAAITSVCAILCRYCSPSQGIVPIVVIPLVITVCYAVCVWFFCLDRAEKDMVKNTVYTRKIK